MSHAEQAQALEHAAAPALAAIEEDSARAPKWLRPLFAAIVARLFDPDLSLERILEAAGYVDAEVRPQGGKHDIWSDLREEVGQAPWTYIRDARLETAAHLLIETQISVSDIGYLVGYGSPSTFRRPMHDFLGMPPAQYRRQAPRLLARAGTPAAGADTNAYWQKVLAGELSDTEARELDDYLGRLAPAGDLATAAGDDERRARLRQTLAEGLVESLSAPESRLTFAEQRRLVRDAVWFPDDTFFELLGRQSTDVGQEDPERGVELAQLAIDSLAANQILEAHPGRTALAWARLARARWRAGDLAGAEQDLERAASDVAEAADDEPPASWKAERRRVEVAFHWLHGRRLDGLDLAAHMVTEHRAASPGAMSHGVRAPGTRDAALARALLLRAELRAAAAELEPSFAETRARVLRDALTDVEEAHGLLDAAAGRRGVLSLWARLLVLIGNRGDRVAGLAQMQRVAAGLSPPALEPGAAPLLCWLEGHSSADAEPLWREAREGFAELDDPLWVARTTLDLARLCLGSRRPGEAAALASELASILGAMTASPQDLATLEPLGRAAPFTDVTGHDLDGAEGVLKRLEWQRRARWALDLAS